MTKPPLFNATLVAIVNASSAVQRAAEASQNDDVRSLLRDAGLLVSKALGKHVVISAEQSTATEPTS